MDIALVVEVVLLHEELRFLDVGECLVIFTVQVIHIGGRQGTYIYKVRRREAVSPFVGFERVGESCRIPFQKVHGGNVGEQDGV